MLRLVGFFIIITGSCGLGFSIVRERSEYLERCRKWRELLEMIENEIAFQKSSLPEICSRLSSRVTGNRRLFLEKMGGALLENRGESLGELWKQGIRKVFAEETLQKEMQQELEDLGEKLCFEDSEMQRKVLRDLENRLEKHEQERERADREKNKLTLCAGVLGGLMITVLLL